MPQQNSIPAVTVVTSHHSLNVPEPIGAGTADQIAKDLKIGSATVKRAEHFSKSLDEAETISPGIRGAVLIGEVNQKLSESPITYNSATIPPF